MEKLRIAYIKGSNPSQEGVKYVTLTMPKSREALGYVIQVYTKKEMKEMKTKHGENIDILRPGVETLAIKEANERFQFEPLFKPFKISLKKSPAPKQGESGGKQSTEHS